MLWQERYQTANGKPAHCVQERTHPRGWVFCPGQGGVTAPLQSEAGMAIAGLVVGIPVVRSALGWKDRIFGNRLCKSVKRRVRLMRPCRLLNGLPDSRDQLLGF